jgi:hypothetical protein
MPVKDSGVRNRATLRARCNFLRRDDGFDCWLWRGSLNKGEARLWMFDPSAGKKRVISGARAGALISGLVIPEGGRAWMGCNNPACVNPDHVLVGSNAEWGKWKADNGLFKGNPLLIAAVTGHRRASAKLDMEKARVIRASKGVIHQTVLAAQHGVCVDTISDIWRGRRWRETSHWSGLGAR